MSRTAPCCRPPVPSRTGSICGKENEAQQLIRAVQERENTMVRLLRTLADCQQGSLCAMSRCSP